MPNISRLFSGSILQISGVWDTVPKSPERGHAWLILYGDIRHISGTASEFTVEDTVSGEVYWSTFIDGSLDTQHFPLGVVTGINATAALTGFSVFPYLIVTSEMKVIFTGGVGALCHITVLDFDYR